MNGFQISASVRMGLLAGILLLGPSLTRSAEAAAAKKTAGATRRILGRALDADGRPVAAATVCLTRLDDSDDEAFEPTVIAQTHALAVRRLR